MGRLWIAVFLVLGLVVTAGAAPKSTFDVMSYTAPPGWQSATSKGVLTFQKLDAKAGTFGTILVSPSSPSAGSLDADFKAAWDSTIASAFKVTDAPQMNPGDTENGWSATSGTARGTLEGVPAAIILITMTGHGKTMNIIVVTNSDTYNGAIGGFLTSVEMKKPAAAPAAPPTPPSAAPPAPAKGTRTTTFADGWTSTAETDWVRVTREGATVYLHYPIMLDDASRADVATYFWNKLVAPRYTVTKKYPYEYSAMSFPYYFAAADVVDRATGKPAYVSLRVVTMNGIASPIETVTATKPAIDALFPDQDKLATILNANKFVVSGDIAGTWTSFTSSAMNMYYSGTGGYAGMNTVAMSDTFVFEAKGGYRSEHVGASGMVGSQTAYQQKYKGTYSVAPWEVTVKRSDGKVLVYDAYYEMSRGGTILHLTNKTATGLTYTLARGK